ncbi:unnamed protein product [Protopolystoma xenopodis]|uniref:Uncharacterized protein n=1 Tax=Protopolystoma xenopodis TaxID=117903 RepID=A0A448XPT8_9PLAT|nr:unnamed protein product [Protopolystoma xenopodis]
MAVPGAIYRPNEVSHSASDATDNDNTARGGELLAAIMKAKWSHFKLVITTLSKTLKSVLDGQSISEIYHIKGPVIPSLTDMAAAHNFEGRRTAKLNRSRSSDTNALTRSLRSNFSRETKGNCEVPKRY